MKKTFFTLLGIAISISGVGATDMMGSGLVSPPDTIYSAAGGMEVPSNEQTVMIETPPPPPSPASDKSNKRHVFTVVEVMPRFRGDLNVWIAQHLQYPSVAAENGVQGRVIVGFVVDADGSVVDAHIVRSVEPALDSEALRLINSMPVWSPGICNGKPVAVKYRCPVTFRLN